jgi:hypothetical protein
LRIERVQCRHHLLLLLLPLPEQPATALRGFQLLAISRLGRLGPLLHKSQGSAALRGQLHPMALLHGIDLNLQRRAKDALSDELRVQLLRLKQLSTLAQAERCFCRCARQSARFDEMRSQLSTLLGTSLLQECLDL